MSGVRILHSLKDWWKFIKIHQYYNGFNPGGYFHNCILGMCRKRDRHFQPWISVPEHIIFTNYQKIRSGASPFYIFGGFCRSGDHHIKKKKKFNPFIASHGRGSARSGAPRLSGRSGDSHFQAFGTRRGLAAVPELRIFTLKTAQARSGAPIFKLKTAQARSGDPHFHARPGARSGALAIFSLCRGTYTYQNTPPPPRGALNNITWLLENQSV